MSDAMNHPLPPELGEPPIDSAMIYAQDAPPPTTQPPTTKQI